MTTEPDFEFEKLFAQRRQEMRDRLRAAIMGKCAVCYDAFSRDESGLPVDNLDHVALRGKVQVEDEIWDSYKGEVLDDPTWLQLAIEANRMIIASNDYHHVFFEGIQVMRETQEGVKILSLSMGS